MDEHSATMETARDTLYREVSKNLRTESILLYEAVGRVVSKDYDAVLDMPPFDRATVDGFAVCASDLEECGNEKPVTLRIVDTICAGEYYDEELLSGQTVRIMTGAPIPEGADAVVRLEAVTVMDEEVTFIDSVKNHENISDKGEDIHEGAPIIRTGDILTPAHAAVLAGQGLFNIEVFQKPKVLVISTGNELVKEGMITQGKIYNSNGPMISLRLNELGFITVNRTCSDSVTEIKEVILEQIGAVDAVITTGGVSIGDRDIIFDVIKVIDAELLFRGVSMKPGSPMLAAKYEDKLIYALSGNPFASAATLELLVLPSLLRMSGRTRCFPDAGPKKLTKDYEKASKEGRRFIRGKKENGYVSIPNNHSSGSISSNIGCNCLIDIEGGGRPLFAGDAVWVVTNFKDEEALTEPIEKNQDDIPILCICGTRNVGKTTFMEKLIRELASNEIKVAAIKHDNDDFVPDVPGTDSARFRSAGAEFISIFSENRSLVYGEQEIPDEETYVRELISQIHNVDLILVEGLKASHFDKLEVLRKGVSYEEEINGVTMLRSASVNGKLLATVSDAPVCEVIDEETRPLSDQIIRFDGDDEVQVAEWLKDFYGLGETKEEWC